MPEEHPRWKEIGENLAADDVARVVERQVNQLDRDQIDQLFVSSTIDVISETSWGDITH